MRHAATHEVHFPVMAGAEESLRDARIAGVVEQAWGDANFCHHDLEPFLRQWLALSKIECSEEEFTALCGSARSRLTTGMALDAHGLVRHLYDDAKPSTDAGDSER